MGCFEPHAADGGKTGPPAAASLGMRIAVLAGDEFSLHVRAGDLNNRPRGTVSGWHSLSSLTVIARDPVM